MILEDEEEEGGNKEMIKFLREPRLFALPYCFRLFSLIAPSFYQDRKKNTYNYLIFFRFISFPFNQIYINYYY